MNLYDCTLLMLHKHNKSFDDIIWIGCNEFCISKEDFIHHSKEINFDSLSLELDYIPHDIVIVGENFWLSRPIHYYEDFKSIDDLWLYNEYPEQPKIIRKISTLSLKKDGNENATLKLCI